MMLLYYDAAFELEQLTLSLGIQDWGTGVLLRTDTAPVSTLQRIVGTQGWLQEVPCMSTSHLLVTTRMGTSAPRKSIGVAIHRVPNNSICLIRPLYL